MLDLAWHTQAVKEREPDNKMILDTPDDRMNRPSLSHKLAVCQADRKLVVLDLSSLVRA